MASAVRCTVLAAALCVVAGGSEHGGGGLRAVGGPGGEVCVPAGPDRLATVSLDRLKNVTDLDVTLTDVSLVDGTGLDVAGWYTVPGDGATPGVVSGFTLPTSSETGVPAGHEAMLVLGLRLDGEQGRAHAAEVTYRVGSSPPRAVRTFIAHHVVPDGTQCF